MQISKVFTEGARIVVPLLILGVGVVGFAVVGKKQAPPRSDPGELVPVVKTVSVMEHTGPLPIETDGVVVPFREIKLPAEVSGRILHKSDQCRKGRFVARGSVLFEIERNDYQFEVDRFEAELQQADASLKELEVERKNSIAAVELGQENVKLQQQLLDRMLRLRTTSAVSADQLDQAKLTELDARDKLLTMNNQLRLIEVRKSRLEFAKNLAKTKLNKAKLDLKRTVIRSPIDGVVFASDVEEDTYVQPGTVLAVIEDVSKAEIQSNLRMEELGWVWQQSGRPTPEEALSTDVSEKLRAGYQLPKVPVDVVYRFAGTEYVWNGYLDRYDGVGLDEKTRTVPCRIVVPHPREVRRPGDTTVALSGPDALLRSMFVQVRMRVTPDAKLLRFPEKALRPGNRVWRVVGGKLDSVAVPRVVIADNQALLAQGSTLLEVGDHVVISPLQSGTEGVGVRDEHVTTPANAQAVAKDRAASSHPTSTPAVADPQSAISNLPENGIGDSSGATGVGGAKSSSGEGAKR